METVILVSVLATLGVVAIVGAIVVAFKKLNTKVDVHDQERIYQSLDDVAHTINRRLDDMDQNFGNEVNDVYRTIDSRCDKLYDLITETKQSMVSLRKIVAPSKKALEIKTGPMYEKPVPTARTNEVMDFKVTSEVKTAPGLKKTY